MNCQTVCPILSQECVLTTLMLIGTIDSIQVSLNQDLINIKSLAYCKYTNFKHIEN